jgi:uracil-DNA glycosylase
MGTLLKLSMHRASLGHPTDFEGWRAAARGLLQAQIPPHEVEWVVGTAPTLFEPLAEPAAASSAALLNVPRGFLDLAEAVIQHRSPARFGVLYQLLWRIVRGDRHLLQVAVDPVVRRAEAMARAVQRDAHRMKSLLRFREVRTGDGARYVAWFEPEHYVLEATAPFFAQRFVNLRWSILTPYCSAHWTGEALRFADGVWQADVATEAALDAHWRDAYADLFNPAVAVPAMAGEQRRCA